MKVVALLLAFACYASAQLDVNGIFGKPENNWDNFKKAFNKIYKDVEEEAHRAKVFASNIIQIEAHNLQEQLTKVHGYDLKVNEYGDLTNDEFRQLRNGYKMRTEPSNAAVFMPPANLLAPSSVDWRQKGYVTPVKNQGQCGSCWAFSTTGSLEGQHFKKTGKLVSLSEQNLVDCAGGKYGNAGCNGGLMDQAFSYIKDNKGIDTEASYPYQGRNGQCKYKKTNVGATDAGFVDIKSGDENALRDAIASVGPVAVAIDASSFSFQFYHSGIYNPWFCSSTRLDHGVLAVGYGSENGKDYFLVKNSWGPGWGDKGYVKMIRNSSNKCGIATQASYPLV